jgi:hypothetical protein
MKDPDLLAEAKKAGWENRPTSGEDLQRSRKRSLIKPPEVVEWLKITGEIKQERTCA